ncbi:hypothetical protein [Streptosporangium minutum]|uniref:Phytanoyl-CoA dioxygenase n=1 Tax=Streptosporangium minutum TaxID=569862 RepID=A0A243RRV0_9ACTN|nr:hypothetical protein [Streptosporangium minutum]OUC97732.1 hypothetical protein CA984_09985 [Streptosporangium minutum]
MDVDPFAPRVFDDVLPPALLEVLSVAAAVLPNRTLSFWTGLDAPEPPLIATVLRHLKALVGLPQLERPDAGVEWWVRRAPAYHFQPWHVDKDEALFMRDGVVRPPAAASILYLSDAGGATIFSSQVCDQEGAALVPRRLERAWTIAPRRNRFVVARGDAVHAVLPSREHAQQVRTSMPINWWPSPMVSNARLATEAADHEALAQLTDTPVPAERSNPVPVPLRTWYAADLPRPVEQRWPAWKAAPQA